LDEYSLAAHYIGNPDISLEKTGAIITSSFFKDIHPDEQNRLKRNMEFYRKAADEKARRKKSDELLQKNSNNK
jgi:hypothetical protein